MYRKFILRTFIAVLALSFAATAGAAAPGRPLDAFKAHLGLAVPLVGDLEDVAGPGFMLGGQWLHRVSGVTDLGAQVDFIFFGEESVAGVDVDVDVLSIQGIARRNLNSTGASKPFLLGGFGIAHTEIDSDVSVGPLGFGVSDDDTGLTFSFGGGVDIPLTTMMLGLTAQYQHFLFDIGNVDGGGALELLAQLRF